MSRYEPQSISPIKMLNNPKPFETPKPYETSAKYLTQRNQTIYEEQYYKEKSQRLQRLVKEFKQETRILQTQNKELKTQIQIYRDSSQTKGAPSNSSYNSTGQRKRQAQQESQQVQRLLKQIRILKNNHEMQMTESKSQQKRLNKKILQLQDKLHQNELSWQSKCQQSQLKVQQKNKQLEKQLKQLRKSVVQYMEQRDQNQHKLGKIKVLLQEKDREIKEVQDRGKQTMEEKVILEEKLNQFISKDKNNMRNSNQIQNVDDSEDFNLKNSQKTSRRKDQLYEFGLNSIRRNPNKQSHLSVHTFNGTRHVPAQQAFQVVESFKSQIHRLENQLQRNSILHVKDKNDLSYMIEKYQKELKEKDNDIVSLLTKVKPLMLEKNKIVPKENISPKKNKFQEEKDTIGKNAFSLKMLDMFLKKYKMEAF